MPREAHPTLRALERLALELWAARPDLRARYGDPASLGYWSWLSDEGARAEPRLLELLPLPPVELRGRVAFDEPDRFLMSGLAHAQNVFEHLRDGGFEPGLGGRLLDFGCGPGRLLRHAARFAGVCELHGVDVDAEAIAWCREHLDFARFEAIAPRPPTPFPDAYFDAVYSYSIFTHLPEELHLRWLAELARIARPGATVVLTTAGTRNAERFLTGDVDPRLTIPAPDAMRARIDELHRRGFLYFPLDVDYAAIPEADRRADVYGMAFLDERYVRAHWLDRFELTAFDPAVGDWQDYVVLRRR